MIKELKPEQIPLAIQLSRPHRRVCGVIVAYWDETQFTHYWAGGGVCSFKSSHSENPMCFISQSAMEKRLKSLQEDQGEWEVDQTHYWAPVLWTHPEAHYQPLPSLLNIKARFPGSPAQ